MEELLEVVLDNAELAVVGGVESEAVGQHFAHLLLLLLEQHLHFLPL